MKSNSDLVGDGGSTAKVQPESFLASIFHVRASNELPICECASLRNWYADEHALLFKLYQSVREISCPEWFLVVRNENQIQVWAAGEILSKYQKSMEQRAKDYAD